MILIKRYGTPLILSVVLYSVIYLIFGNGSPYFGMGLVLSVILGYLMRICDDIGDYEKDKAKGKTPIRKEILIVMGALATSVFLILTLISKAYPMAISLWVILLQFFITDKYRDIIKPLFMPVIVIALVISFFAPGFWLAVIVPILIIFDIVLIVLKRCRRKI